MRLSVALALGLALLSASSRLLAQQAPPEPADDDWSAQLSFVEEYRLRIASGMLSRTGALGEAQVANQETDQHLRLTGDTEVVGYDEHLRMLASGALWYDLDGPSAREAQAQFATTNDNANPFIAVYALSGEWQRQGILDYARIGRQASEHGMPLTFDGGSVGVRLVRQVQLFGFGGRTVHFYETKPNLLENWVGSVGATYRPAPAWAFELDLRATREQILVEDRSARVAVTDGSYGASGIWRSELMQVKLNARGVNSALSHVGGAYSFEHPGLGLGLDARIAAQLVTLGEVNESENPFFSLLGPSLPYARFRFEAWKEFSLGSEANLGLQLGWRQRQLLADEPQAFNRNTGTLYFSARIDDLIREGLFIGGTAEYHFVPQSTLREWLLAYGGSAGFNGDRVKTELGTYFQQYKINYYQQAEELHDTRTLYGSVSYRILDALELRGRYEMDIFDRYLQTFTLSAREDF